VKLRLTHEEIAQRIGTSRETVSRLLADLKNRQVLQTDASTLLIRNKGGAESDGHHSVADRTVMSRSRITQYCDLVHGKSLSQGRRL